MTDDLAAVAGPAVLRHLSGMPPAGAGTWDRWEWLAATGGTDLCLAKLVEPHLDATSVLADLGDRPPAPGSVWAVWAAEPPFAVVEATGAADDLRLVGTKAFCSGWRLATDAMMTVRHDGASRLVRVDVAAARQAGQVRPVGPPWVGTGMARAGTATLELDGVAAVAMGEPDDYTGRPRFWDNAIGVAAVWFGGARAVAGTLRDAARRRPLGDHALAHLGAVASVLDRTEAHLRLAAQVVDAGTAPVAARRALAESVRASVAHAVTEVVDRTGRALGPGPLAFDTEHATRVADLQVFVRQHHAETDLAALGRLVADGEDRTW